MLRDLCQIWQSKVRPIPPAYPISDCWGPSHADIQDAAAAATHGNWDEEIDIIEEQSSTVQLPSYYDGDDYESDDQGYFSDSEDSELDVDSELVEEIELMLWRDATSGDDSGGHSAAWDVSSDSIYGAVTGEKRPRTSYE